MLEAGDVIVDAGRTARLLDLLVGRVGLSEAQVLAHGRVKQVRLLADDANEIRERREGDVLDVNAVDAHRAALGVVEACHEIAERGLARSRLSHDRRARAGRGKERRSGNRPRARLLVAEPDVIERDLALHVVAIERARAVVLIDVDFEIEVLKDAIEQRQRCLHVDADAEQRTDREEDPRLDRGERDERTDADRTPAVGNRQPTSPVDECRQDREGRTDRGHHPTARHALTHLKLGELP